MQQDYYSVLANVIMASARDNARLRRVIYELARTKLRQHLDRETKELGHTEGAQQLLALENAIEQIEADLASNNLRQTYSVVNPVTHSLIEIIPPARHLPPSSEPPYEFTAEHMARPASSVSRWVLLVGAVILVAATYIAIERGLHEAHQSQSEVLPNTRRNSISSPPPDIPTPSTYGVYALTNGQLTELEPLPIKVPDQRVAISGTISTPSTAKLSNGRARFIVFRRDLAKNAPEKVVVRVVARVMRASASNHNEEATTSSVGHSWAVRGVSYNMKVAPVRGNPTMILISPADVDFLFPAGRYALVLKAVAYDFSVDGPITDLAQCIERTDELDAPTYTQCRNP